MRALRSGGALEAHEASATRVPKQRRDAPQLSLAERATLRLECFCSKVSSPPYRRIFRLNLMFITESTPSSSSPVVGSIAVVSSPYIGEGLDRGFQKICEVLYINHETMLYFLFVSMSFL
jgi:hypothetical protein